MKPLLNDVTVFMISSGEESTVDCERALMEQDCTFTIKHIKDTFPMSSAFQRMPDECDTRYFIQVDSDMILKPHAVQTLYKEISQSFFMTYMIAGQLYEEGLGISGAVKCWKSRLFKYFSFRDCRTVDRNLYRRTKLMGLRFKILDKILGDHMSRHSPYTEYLKTKSDIEKRRFLKIPPERHDLAILDRSIENLPSTSHELLGALVGALTPKERLARSKDAKLETARYNEILQYLGTNSDLAALNRHEVNRDDLNALFYKSYKETGSNHTGTKLALAEKVINIFGTAQSIDPLELLSIISR